MSYRVGDLVFRSHGQPSIVSSRNKNDGTAVLDSDRAEIRKATRHGFINGIDPGRREEFNAVMDEVKALDDPEQRVDHLRGKIAELQADPRNQQMVHYLQGEMNHLMNTFSVRPRFYKADEFKLR